jgi:hypothetical protein
MLVAEFTFPTARMGAARIRSRPRSDPEAALLRVCRSLRCRLSHFAKTGGLRAQLIADLARGEWLALGDNVVFAGRT